MQMRLTRAEERIKKLGTQADRLRNQVDEAAREAADNGRELDKLRGQHDSLRTLVAVRAERIRELETALADGQRDIDELEARLASDQGPVEAPAPPTEDDAASAATDGSPSTPPQTGDVAPSPTTASAGDDDLRAIKGIGPKYDKLLKSHGIRRWEQIASWTEADIARVASELNINAKRIHRGNWVDKAQQLLVDRDGAADR